MTSTFPDTWPERPDAFYSDWDNFCQEVLSVWVKNKSGGALLAVLLGGGAVLGAGGLATLVAANQDYLDEKGKEWGVNNLSALLLGGGTLLGAVLGGLGGALLGKHLDKPESDDLQAQLEDARREYMTLKQDAEADLLPGDIHRLAVEHLFWKLTMDYKDQ